VICHVIHALGVGGAEVLVDQMVRRMSERFRCVVAVLDEVGEIGQKLIADGFDVELLERRPGIDRRCARRLREFARRQHAAILHAHQYTPFFQSLLSRGVTGRRPIVFTEHGRHVPDLPSRKRTLVNRMLLRRGDRLIGCGNSVREALIANEGLPARRVEVIHNGVDLAAFGTPSQDARSKVRSEFGIAEADPLAVMVARLHALKDHETALRAIELARRSIPDLKLLIVGDGDRRQQIQESIGRLNLTGAAIPAGARSDVPDLLAAADLFLLTSISEGIPLTVIEAMAAGRPVVATAVGGLPELVQPGLTGALAAAGDAESLANHLVRLCGDAELRAEQGRAGRDLAHRQFGLDVMLRRYEQVYDEVIAARHRPREAFFRFGHAAAPGIASSSSVGAMP
jgi:glycosyltransferase involved in cell wall biosynthesis